ncbi:Protein of unknown function [Marinospirillum celere]|uniref:DUF726 domain-containing protein n=1 Tax=Marinospirillum celere TaxID=1122252 RepID=A0A1I1EP27_9GAMM|nr:DUF726 domain-containing protein [Marinospirillum celere]SFB86690.1 Protein of unknown function [Marinospirillum celere]
MNQTSFSKPKPLAISTRHRIIPCRPGSSDSAHRVIIVNGFLTQDDQEAKDWLEALSAFRQTTPVHYFTWESKSKKELVEFGAALASAKGAQRLVRLAINPWHTAMLNAQLAGQKLAVQIREQGVPVTLIGHSLGARVVFSALLALAAQPKPWVDHAVLLGGAVGRSKEKKWCKAASAVQGQLHNCYSDKDYILKHLYQWVNLGMSRPAGLGEAVGPTVNHDFSDLVEGHTRWIANLPEVLNRIGLR